MQSKFLSLILLGFYSTFAAAGSCTGNKSNKGYCETLTYSDITISSANPPSTSKCEASCHSVTTDAGDWSVSFVGKPAGYVQRMVNSDCSFSVGRVGVQLLETSLTMN